MAANIIIFYKGTEYSDYKIYYIKELKEDNVVLMNLTGSEILVHKDKLNLTFYAVFDGSMRTLVTLEETAARLKKPINLIVQEGLENVDTNTAIRMRLNVSENIMHKIICLYNMYDLYKKSVRAKANNCKLNMRAKNI